MTDFEKIYKSRIDAALSFINNNIEKAMDLSLLAETASFSAFHFHRIFSAALGETPQKYLNRIRLEKAANLLIKIPVYTITEIAVACGFSSSSTFARSFKKHFSIAANEYRESRKGIDPMFSPANAVIEEENIIEDIMIKKYPAMTLAYFSTLAGYNLNSIKKAWEQIYLWAEVREHLTENTKYVGISYDDPQITPAEKCRYYACVTIPMGTQPKSPIGVMEIPEGKYAVVQTKCRADEIAVIYQYMYRSWLPKSGYQPADRPPFEFYLETPDNNPGGKYFLEICLPVIPL